ncbi:MAG: cell division protein ZapA [Halocynthiibacter sp.]
MPEVRITIGGRDFEVSCQPGEESFLLSAASLLTAEADALTAQIGRLPEARMLLMAGLMLADKTAGLEEKLAAQHTISDGLRVENEALKNVPMPEPEKIEVPVVPEDLIESLSELTARAESIAGEVEEKLKQSTA